MVGRTAMMLMLLRRTVMLRTTKRTVASNSAGAHAKRASAATPTAGNVLSRGTRSHTGDAHQPGGRRSRAVAEKRNSRGEDRSAGTCMASASSSVVAPIATASIFVPDYRERVVQIFQRLADINNALQERYKAQSYQVAVDNLKRDDFIFLHLPPNIMLPGVDDAKRKELLDVVNATPGVGEKLKMKMVEILSTGDLAELHSLQAKPVIRAIQELTQVHGVGPRTAVSFYKKYGVKTIAELRERVKAGVSEASGGGGSAKKPSKVSPLGAEDSILHLTEAQRIGLKYYHDIMQPIPHEEVRLHEAFLKLRLRKYLGNGYELSICGSFRRRRPTSGDVDVLITRKTGGGDVAAHQQKNKRVSCGVPILAPQEVLAAFVDALKKERYIEGTLAQGATKFMGVSRLKSYNYNAGATSPKLYPARRLDIRFVEPECFPAALLYFTGSKNFNVIMRAEAIRQNYVLNEYGLFHSGAAAASCASDGGNEGSGKNSKGFGRGRWNAEAFQKLVRAQYYSAKSPAFAEGGGGGGGISSSGESNRNENADEDDSFCGDVNTADGRKSKKKVLPLRQQQEELAVLWREVEARRVKVKHERDIFAALGMAYVHPEQRQV